MILGLGIDLVEIPRIARAYARFGENFATRILHGEELATMPVGAGAAQFIAARFAAKEAAVKALGTGFSNGICFTDFCVSKNEMGQPMLNFYGAASAACARLGATRAHLSLTHGRDTAAAVVVLEK